LQFPDREELQCVRSIFGILGMLVVVAITGFLVKKQFDAESEMSICMPY
jgi:hypothetical protein